MARKVKEAEEKKFIEINYEGKEFKYSCRLHPEFQKETEKCTITPVSVTLNGVITVKGVKLFQTDKNAWLQFPQYETKKGNKTEYKDYFYIDKEFSEHELTGLVYELEKALEK